MLEWWLLNVSYVREKASQTRMQRKIPYLRISTILILDFTINARIATELLLKKQAFMHTEMNFMVIIMEMKKKKKAPRKNYY